MISRSCVWFLCSVPTYSISSQKCLKILKYIITFATYEFLSTSHVSPWLAETGYKQSKFTLFCIIQRDNIVKREKFIARLVTLSMMHQSVKFSLILCQNPLNGLWYIYERNTLNNCPIEQYKIKHILVNNMMQNDADLCTCTKEFMVARALLSFLESLT